MKLLLTIFCIISFLMGFSLVLIGESILTLLGLIILVLTFILITKVENIKKEDYIQEKSLNGEKLVEEEIALQDQTRETPNKVIGR